MISAVVVLLLLVGPALAHDAPSGWQYPTECCSDRDCKQISCVKLEAMIQSGQVPASIIRKSGDTDCHLCQQPFASTNKYYCAFRPDLTN